MSKTSDLSIDHENTMQGMEWIGEAFDQTATIRWMKANPSEAMRALLQVVQDDNNLPIAA